MRRGRLNVGHATPRHICCGLATSIRENQALVGVLSTQLWHDQFVERPVYPRMLDIAAADVVLQDAIPVS